MSSWLVSRLWEITGRGSLASSLARLIERLPLVGDQKPGTTPGLTATYIGDHNTLSGRPVIAAWNASFCEHPLPKLNVAGTEGSGA